MSSSESPDAEAMDVTTTEPVPEVASPEKEAPEPEDDNESEGEADVAEPPKRPGLLQLPVEVEGKRARAKPALFAAITPTKAVAEFEVLPGKGKALGDLDNVNENITAVKNSDLKDVYNMVFARRGKEKEFKRHLRLFSGFPAGTDRAKRLENMGRFFLPALKEACRIFGLERGGTKEEIAERLVEWLQKPSGKGGKKKSLTPGKKAKTPSKEDSAKKAKKTPAKAKKPSTPVAKPRAAVSLYAVDVRDAIKEEHADLDDAALMKMIRAQYEALGADEKAPYEEKAKAEAEAQKAPETEEEESAAEEEASEGEEEEEEEEEKPKKKAPKKVVKKAAATPKPKAKKVTPAKRKVEDSDSDDDAPLAKKAKKPPTDKELNTAVVEIMKNADLAELSKKKVREGVAALFPDADLTARKDFLNTCIEKAMP